MKRILALFRRRYRWTPLAYKVVAMHMAQCEPRRWR